MVDAIVNRNKSPQVVAWRGYFPSEAALFAENHDWKEERRVHKAIEALEKDQTEAVWEELVKRTRDRRYCETVTSGQTCDARVRTVGDVCEDLASRRLKGVFERHLPRVPLLEAKPIYLEVGVNDVSKWRKQRAAKSLYELQIAICESALKALAREKGIRQAEKDQARKKIEAEITKLKKTKQPVLVQVFLLYEDRGKYDTDIAQRVRDGIKSGKFGYLGIIK